MKLILEQIDFEKYSQKKSEIIDLISQIWTGDQSFNNTVDSIERWYNQKESGCYFYIIDTTNNLANNRKIGITGYWPIRNNLGSYGLRHHGTTIKGTGKNALELLIKYINENENDFSQLVEFIPEGREDLIEKFKEWGFVIDPNGVPEWEPKRDYYKYCMIKTL